MKKLLSIVLALAMLLRLSVPAFATGSTDTVTSTDGGSNTGSHNVTASYTPSAKPDDEAKWGASADSLTGSGTLAQALAAATTNSDVKYIQLQTNVTEATSRYMITDGSFTLDLNGKTISSNGYTITIGNDINNSNSGIDVTFTDSSSGGKVETTSSGYPAITVMCGKVTFTGGSYGCINMSDSGNAVPYAEVTINGGSFTVSSGYAIGNHGGKLTVTGGSFSGDTAVICTTGTNGTTTIKGGTLTGSIHYEGGKLDLSSYNGTTALTDLTVYNFMETVTVGDDTIKLPAGYAFYKSDDENKATVTELTRSIKYAIKSTSGGTTTKYDVTVDSTITNGTVTANPTSAAAGDTITLTVTPATDYELDKLTVTYGDSNTTVTTTAGENNTYTFTMPAGAVAVSATFKSTKVEITGVTVTIDGTEYSSANTSATSPAKIKPDTNSITYTIKGANLDKLPDTFRLTPVSGIDLAKSNLHASGDGASTTGTLDSDKIKIWFPKVTTAFEVTYTLDGSTWVNTGVYYIYDSGTATITGVSIEVKDANGTTVQPSSNVYTIKEGYTVTYTVTGTHLDKGSSQVYVKYASGTITDINKFTWSIATDGNSATREIPTSNFTGTTTAFQIHYSNDKKETWKDTGIYIIYQAETTSVNISWGSMNFTYSDEQVNSADKGWTCDEHANEITVENQGTKAIKAIVAFTKSSTASNITNVSGSFGELNAMTLNATGKHTFTLTLTGKPDGALDGVTIGQVTVTITAAGNTGE